MLHDLVKSDRQAVAEAEVTAFRDALGPFVTAAEVTRMPMMFTGVRPSTRPIVFVNQAFLDLTRFEEHEVMGQNFYAFIEPETDPEMLSELRTAFDGGRDLEVLVRYLRKDAPSIWVTINVAPVRNGAGKVVQFFASFIDMTSQKEVEHRLSMTIEKLRNEIKELSER